METKKIASQLASTRLLSMYTFVPKGPVLPLRKCFFLGYFSWRGAFLEKNLKYYNLYKKTKKNFKMNINGKIKSIQKLYLESSNLFAINKKKSLQVHLQLQYETNKTGISGYL